MFIDGDDLLIRETMSFSNNVLFRFRQLYRCRSTAVCIIGEFFQWESESIIQKGVL